MGDRLTPNWTTTAAEAYGASGDIGRRGEVLVCSKLNQAGLLAQDFEEQYKEQVAGIDISVNGCTIDVKANLHNQQFWIETGTQGWLFNPRKTSHIILHVDISTEEVVWYPRLQAVTFIRRSASPDSLVHITTDKFRSNFMSRSWDNLFIFLQGDKCSQPSETVSG